MVKLDNTKRRTVLKGIGASAVGGAVLSGTASAKTTATAEFQDFGDGRTAETNVSGTVHVNDKPDEKDIVVSGTATGLNPGDFYVSLFYDKQGPGPGEERGLGPCEPSLECLSSDENDRDDDGDGKVDEPDEGNHPGWCLTFQQMLAAYWSVDSNGNGTAHDWPQELPAPFNEPAEYAHLANLGTISIRNVSRGFRREACAFIVRD